MKIALITYIITALLGLFSFVLGVYVLAGTGWSLISASLSLMLIATFIRNGLITGKGGITNG